MIIKKVSSTVSRPPTLHAERNLMSLDLTLGWAKDLKTRLLQNMVNFS